MEETWIAERGKLRALLNNQAKLSNSQLADQCGHSGTWVKKWKKRLKNSAADDLNALRSQSRKRHELPRPLDKRIETAILEIRDQPPADLNRVPGAPTILYYLNQREDLRADGLAIPKSTSTIWKVLKRNQRTGWHQAIHHQPLEPTAPMDTWEIDFTDVPTVIPDPDGKKQHAVETFNVIDTGTSILIDAIPNADYNAESAIAALIAVFDEYGVPRQIRLDRDPRLVGSWSAQAYPSAFMRFLLCIGVDLDICPPHRPDLKPFIERFNRTLEYECFRPNKPTNLDETLPVTAHFKQFYNVDRPHQGRQCANRPPRAVYPDAKPARKLPVQVDPDAWLRAYQGKTMTRTVDSAGTIAVDRFDYYVSRALRGRTVLITVDAAAKQLNVELDGKRIKQLTVKGLYQQSIAFVEYADLIIREARSEARRQRLVKAARRPRLVAT